MGRAISGSWRIAGLLGSLVFSHWILDRVTHRPDLPLWPRGPTVGLGLWNSIPALCTRGTRANNAVGRWALVALVVVTGCDWISQPWSPPPPSARAVAWEGLILWLLPPWALWIDRHRPPRSSKASQ